MVDRPSGGFGQIRLVAVIGRIDRPGVRLVLAGPAATRAAVLDIAPTRHVLHHVDLALATAYEMFLESWVTRSTFVPGPTSTS